METPASKERNANIEFLRILAMIMVIVLHNLAGSGALYEQSGFSYHFYWWMEALAVAAVDIFVLISAYFLFSASFNLRNILRILAITWTYAFPLSFLSAKLSGNPINAVSLVKMFFPILTKKYWFVNAYLAMYLLSPFINKLLQILSREKFAILLWIEIGIMIVKPTLFPKKWAQDLTAGLSVFFFITLYCIAVWIRLYGKQSYSKKAKYHLFLYLFLSLFLVLLKALLMHLGVSEDTASRYYSYDSAIVVLQALSLFLAFLSMKQFKGQKASRINLIARHSFAAYIVHYSLNSVLWRTILHIDHFVAGIPIGPLVIMSSSVFVYFACVLLDSLRAQIARAILRHTDSLMISNWLRDHIQLWNTRMN